jgi:hypothetical protein
LAQQYWQEYILSCLRSCAFCSITVLNSMKHILHIISGYWILWTSDRWHFSWDWKTYFFLHTKHWKETKINNKNLACSWSAFKSALVFCEFKHTGWSNLTAN